jgi:hypothetical protein
MEKLTPFTLQRAPKHRHLKHKNLAISVLLSFECLKYWLLAADQWVANNGTVYPARA